MNRCSCSLHCLGWPLCCNYMLLKPWLRELSLRQNALTKPSEHNWEDWFDWDIWASFVHKRNVIWYELLPLYRFQGSACCQNNHLYHLIELNHLRNRKKIYGSTALSAGTDCLPHVSRKVKAVSCSCPSFRCKKAQAVFFSSILSKTIYVKI